MGNITRSQGGEESSYTLIKTWEGSLDVLCRVPARQQCFHQRRRKMRWRRSCSERGISEWKRERERDGGGKNFILKVSTQDSRHKKAIVLSAYFCITFHFIFLLVYVCVCAGVVVVGRSHASISSCTFPIHCNSDRILYTHTSVKGTHIHIYSYFSPFTHASLSRALCTPSTSQKNIYIYIYISAAEVIWKMPFVALSKVLLRRRREKKKREK